MRKTFLRAVGVFAAALMLCLSALPAYAVQKDYYDMQKIQEGDVIYFDNSLANFDSVRIHIWADYGSGKSYDMYPWNIRPTMTNEDGDNIWEFVVPSKADICNARLEDAASCMESFSFSAGFDHLLFSDSKNDNARQTDDLNYVTSGLLYRAQSREDGHRIELFSNDIFNLLDKLEAGKAYGDKIKCVDDEEAQRFITIIDGLRINVETATTVTVENGQLPSDISFWRDTEEIQNVSSLITDTIASIKEKYGENPTVCDEDATDDESDSESDNPDTFDTIGLFAGLGVASFAGLAIALNRKRRI